MTWSKKTIIIILNSSFSHDIVIGKMQQITDHKSVDRCVASK